MNEDESWPRVIAGGLLLVATMGIAFVYLWLLAPAGAAYPR